MSPDELKTIRRELGLSLAQLAAAIKISPELLRRFETPAGKSSHRAIPDAIAERVRGLQKPHG